MEIGTFFGGSALWFADMLDAHRIEGARVVTVDVNAYPGERDPRITYLTEDAKDLESVLGDTDLASFGRPWLVVDDGSHVESDIAAFLEWVHPKLRPGDYVVVEDGSVRYFADPQYDAFDDGPNRAVAGFLQRHPDDYEIDAELCDFFGYNVTWNPNAWMRRR